MRKVLYIAWPTLGVAKWFLIPLSPPWVLPVFIVVGLGIAVSVLSTFLPGASEARPWKKKKRIYVTS